MLENILSHEMASIINQRINPAYLYEIRLRKNKPVVVNYKGINTYLSPSGISSDVDRAIYVTQTEILDVVKRAVNYSIYACNEQIKNAYICMSGGIRMGLCGELVLENGKIKTMKNFSSINIRIPHQIQNCSLNTLPFIYDDGRLQNTLVISPPGAGKTTYIRDVCLQLSKQTGECNNILILDERNEIAPTSYVAKNDTINLGSFCDVISNCSKRYGFECGIRSMKPDIIVTDELADVNDANACEYASSCGVSVLATIHANGIDDLRHKEDFKALINKKIFKRYVVLSTRNGPGTYEGIYDENFRCIWI